MSLSAKKTLSENSIRHLARHIGKRFVRGWGAQGFPTSEVDFPSLEFLKQNSTKVLEHV